ncbi:MAG: hypothetical protein QW733_02020 [Desulfurococcaceae archaeon]
MSEEIRIVIPAAVAQAIRKKSQEKKIPMEDLILRAIIKVLEEDRG